MELQKTIAPPLAICGSAFWTVKNAPFVLIANVLSKSSSLHSATVPRDKMPAFTKRMSICPNFDLTSLMNSSRSLRELTSPANPKESSPIVLSAESIVFPSLPMMATFAPSARNNCALAKPMPLLPPVTTATFPANFFDAIVLLFLVDKGVQNYAKKIEIHTASFLLLSQSVNRHGGD